MKLRYCSMLLWSGLSKPPRTPVYSSHRIILYCFAKKDVACLISGRDFVRMPVWLAAATSALTRIIIIIIMIHSFRLVGQKNILPISIAIQNCIRRNFGHRRCCHRKFVCILCTARLSLSSLKSLPKCLHNNSPHETQNILPYAIGVAIFPGAPERELKYM